MTFTEDCTVSAPKTPVGPEPAASFDQGRNTLTAPVPPRRRAPVRHRAIFLSDLHLGTRMCRADAILGFLDQHEADEVYLVGDVVDNWRTLARSWPAAHHVVLRRLLDLAKSGTKVVYIPGNHDAFFRDFAGATFDGIQVRLEMVHTSADGRRFLVTHGDQCDIFSRRAPVLAKIGSLLETTMREVDALQRRVSRAIGRAEWQGITRLISRTNALIRKHDRFEERLCDLAEARGLDGIICGHFHQPALHRRNGPIYANCGDWVENNTALVEATDVRIRMIDFTGQIATEADRQQIADDGQAVLEAV